MSRNSNATAEGGAVAKPCYMVEPFPSEQYTKLSSSIQQLNPDTYVIEILIILVIQTAIFVVLGVL